MYHNINYCFHVSIDDDEDAKRMKVLEAEKGRAAMAFLKKCETVKSKKQNVENKKNKKKRGKISESEKKGIFCFCIYFRLRNLTCFQLSSLIRVLELFLLRS